LILFDKQQMFFCGSQFKNKLKSVSFTLQEKKHVYLLYKESWAESATIRQGIYRSTLPIRFKVTVPRDFRLLVLFMNQFPPTPVANGKNLQSEKF